MNTRRRTASLLLGALIVSGCAPDNRQADIKKCIVRAAAEAPPRRDGQGQEEVHDAIGALVVDCMKDLNYRHDMTDEKCVDDVDFDPSCYVPRH
jgi:hypothetical protein